MSVRLTNEMREEIIAKILDHKFSSMYDELKSKHAALAEKAYNKNFPEKHRKLMGELPKGWLEEKTHINVRTPFDGHHSLIFCGSRKAAFSDGKAVTKRFPYKGGELQLDRDDPFLQEFKDHLKERDDLDSEYSKYRADVKAVVYKVTTTGRLIETWPEIKTFVWEVAKKYAPKGSNVPMIVIEKLNEGLNLPPKKGKAA